MSQIICFGVLGTGFGHERVALGAAFDDARFFASRAVGDLVGGDACEHVIQAQVCLSFAGGRQDGPLRLFEAVKARAHGGT